MLFKSCEYIEENPDINNIYYYRIYTEDEFGHFSYSNEKILFMDDVVDLYGTSGDTENSQFGMKEILPLTLAISFIALLFGGVLLYRSKNAEEIDENIQAI